MRSLHLAAIVLCFWLSACSNRMAAPQPEGGGARAGAPQAARAEGGAGPGFERTLELQGITFKVSCTNASSVNRLNVAPSGLEISNDPIAVDIDGTVTGAEVADLNADGSPEVYVYLRSADSGSFGKLVAYSANRRKSLSEIYLPPVSENPEASRGYMGHDELSVIEQVFVRRFPVYLQDGGNSKPSGKTRQLQYRLVQGEAGWRLKLNKTVEY